MEHKNVLLGSLSLLLVVTLIAGSTSGITSINQTDQTFTGTLDSTGDEESFVYTASVAGIYEFSLDGDAGTDFDFEVYDESGNFEGSGTSVSYPDTETLDLPAGDYTITVYSYSGSGSFTLDVTYVGESTTTDDGVLGEFSGTLDNGGEDYHSLSVNVEGNTEFSLTADGGTDFDFSVRDSLGNQIGAAAGTSYPDETTIYLTPDTYEIRIYSFSGSGSYTLTVTFIGGGTTTTSIGGGFSTDVESFSYSSEFSVGDTMRWSGSVTDSTSTSEVSAIVEVLSDDLTVTEATADAENFELSLSEDGETDIEIGSTALFLIIPTTVTFENGTTAGIEAGFAVGFGFDPSFFGGFDTEFTETEYIVSVSGSDSFLEFRYDLGTGILLSYTIDEGSDYQASITLQSSDVATGGGGLLDGLNLPFNFAYGFLVLLAIPIFRRRLNA